MKVTITKTTDISALANEVRGMLHQAKSNLAYRLPDKINEIIRSSLSQNGEEFFSNIELLSSFRQDLADFDNTLQEIQNILIGYKHAVDPTKQAQRQKEAEKEEEGEPDLEWVQREQAEYEKLMAQIDGADEVEDEEG